MRSGHTVAQGMYTEQAAGLRQAAQTPSTLAPPRTPLLGRLWCGQTGKGGRPCLLAPTAPVDRTQRRGYLHAQMRNVAFSESTEVCCTEAQGRKLAGLLGPAIRGGGAPLSTREETSHPR